METVKQMNVMIIDDSEVIENLMDDCKGSFDDICKSHIVIHRGRVLKNVYGSVFQGA